MSSGRAMSSAPSSMPMDAMARPASVPACMYALLRELETGSVMSAANSREQYSSTPS